MTTWPGPYRRFAATARFTLLLAAALFVTPSRANAAVMATVVAGQLRVTSNSAADSISLNVSADQLRVEVRNFGGLVNSFLLTGFTSILVDAGGGDDTVTIDETVDTFTDDKTTTILGGDGTDHLNGGVGAEVIQGGAGEDTIDGGPGNDTIDGGADGDVMRWNSGTTILQPSDGSDVVDGVEVVIAAGTDFDETWDLDPSGQRLLLMRSGGAITVSIGGAVQSIVLDMRGGNDTFGAGAGLPTAVSTYIVGGDGIDDISCGAGNDSIYGGDGSDVLRGGPGNDTIQGEAGDDLIFGDAGNDTILGGLGDDTIAGNLGDDRFIWNVAHGIDEVNGWDGIDTLTIEGTPNTDVIQLSRNGVDPQRIYILKNQAPLSAQDVGTVERVEIKTFAGDDNVGMGPFSQGLLQEIAVDLGPGNDDLFSQHTAAPVVVTGGVGDFDQLTFSAGNAPAGWAPPTISVNGVVKMTYAEFESIDLQFVVGTLPSIDITTPTSAPSTTASTPFVTLAGTAADAEGLQRVTWSNDRGGSGIATGTTTWAAPNVPLQPGTNVITVSAIDTNNNSASRTLVVQLSGISYSLAEGATGSFFDLDVLIANPTTTPAPITVTFLREGASAITQNLTLAPTSRTTLHVDEIPGLENQGGVSTVVTSTAGVSLVVERSMFWDASYYGSHGGTAVDGPGTRWLFAEGSEGFFNTFLLLANAGLSPSNVTLTFLREGSTPFVKTLTVPASSRVTVAANGIPELVGRSFSIVVDASTPIIAERAMYFGTARLFDGGHESTGVPGGSTSWFLAEGATGPFFETFVLVGNPNPVAANVTFTFLTGGGQTVVRNKVIPANGRLTIDVEYEDPILANAAVSTTITSDQPVIAERAMYWPGPPSTWAEAHNSFGATTLGTKWGLAEGRVGMTHGFQTYILLANPSTTAANVRITFLRANGTTVVKTFTVAPTSRFNVDAGSVAPELQNEAFGALIEVTNGIGISVERAMYSDAAGQVWAAGTNALATRLP